MPREFAASITRHEPVVYYVTSTHGGIVKIGTTMDVRLRWARLRRAQPALRPVLLAYEWGREDVERTRHRQFADDQQRGEWFWLTDRLRKWIEEAASEADPDVLRALQLAAQPEMYSKAHEVADALRVAGIHSPLVDPAPEPVAAPPPTIIFPAPGSHCGASGKNSGLWHATTSRPLTLMCVCGAEVVLTDPIVPDHVRPR